jgi:serine-type D-Ala-D-Ala carboxypeptidase/endopeptidase (penicillin-binding protein 4)
MSAHARPRLRPTLPLAVAAAAALLLPASAASMPPDRPGHTSVAAGADRAHVAVSISKLRHGLARKARKSGGVTGVWVKDLEAGRVLFKRLAKRRLALASNMKLFTTGAAITRFGTAETLDTEAWALGRLGALGTLHGSLLLRGGGDPTLTSARIARLAARVRAAGVRRVEIGLRFDDSIFDRRLTVPSAGVSGGPYLGSLSGLSVDWGLNRRGRLLKDPGRTAATLFLRALRRRGVSVPGRPKRRTLSPGAAEENRLALVRSEEMSGLIAATNQPSDNFLAEMLAKDIGARLRRAGTTATGVRVIRGFARKRGAILSAQNGSGLSVRNRASVRSVGRFLTAMLRERDKVAGAFLDSLSTAGQTGTLADRMRGTAADGRCHGKTGTLDGVSALSGYCRAPGGRMLAFSILMNKVDILAAHAAQDRMAALIAQYRP